MSEQRTSSEWMPVYMTSAVHVAQIVVGRLEHEGIPALVHQEPGANALGITVGSLGQVQVMVPAEYYEQAQDLLAQPPSTAHDE